MANGDAKQSSAARWPEPAGASEGDVVVYRSGVTDRAPHDNATCSEIARTLATLKGFRFAGEYDERTGAARPRYFVPTDTLIGVDLARMLGIMDEHDLFGGVAPHPFVATKCISHSLVDDKARAPDGWSDEFARHVRPAVLLGFAAFSVDDAVRAGLQLLPHGAVRVKRALGVGGRGQTVVGDRDQLERALADTDVDELRRYGISLEQDLAQVTTYSVGQVRVDDLVASYYGTQRVTANNAGALVYGGSDLLVARGDFEALSAFDPDAAARRAIERACLYDHAAFRCFTGLFASRRNYDVAEGTDASGRRRSGVLEQSWRIGGASGAEVEALAAFRADPSLNAVRATSMEIYGSDAVPPAHAVVYFHGTDDRVGPLIKYTTLEPYVDA